MTSRKQQKLAVLIDAENAQKNLTSKVLLRAACYGTLTVKRAYGDWSRLDMRRFRPFLHHHAIETVHLYRHATGKNAADIVLSIDAVDLMNTGQFDAICIVSSDSDFTPLAMRIRRDGLRVYGFGDRTTPAAFVGACTTFIYTESLKAAERDQ